MTDEISLRCKVTGNPCGTDTWRVGYVCPCESCQAYVKAEEIIRRTINDAKPGIYLDLSSIQNAWFRPPK